MTATIQQTIDELRETLTDYIEATYHIGHPTMVAQRQRLLSTVSGIFQVPYLESTPRYMARDRYEDLRDLPRAAQDAFIRLSRRDQGRPVIFNPPYTHQSQAVREILGNGNNLMIMTGTGSGKTESFLLPILGKFAIEAKDRPQQFRRHNAIRAMILYPMNALVNDQLGRLRLLFGHPRVVAMFEEWSARPARFARYTSRTPYAGVRSPNKDSNRLSSIGDFFVEIDDAALRDREDRPRIAHEDEAAAALYERLRIRGKWPAKPSISDWFGRPHQQWRDRQGRYQRAILGPHDAELLTRHEVQQSPPDLLITNYSMLEYMMMRPIERPIFDQTREWLRQCPDENILVVLDEAHLYRGAQGAEVGLLMRRFRERLGIGPERLQVVCATASFSEEGRALAGAFGSQLCGVPENSFVSIRGDLAMRSPDAAGSQADAQILAELDLSRFYSANDEDQAGAIRPFLQYRNRPEAADVARSLFDALDDFPPFNRLVNQTMISALPLADLGGLIFPEADVALHDRAITALLALGSRARRASGDASLLPCRIHSFFRGLPGLWVCMDPQCTELSPEERGGPAGRLYSQPMERCACGAPVLEYFTCRHCGTSYARAYTDDVQNPHFLWPEPGERLQTDVGLFEAYEPLDLLLEDPSEPARGMPANYDLRTGMINSPTASERQRIVHLPPRAQDLGEGDARGREGARPGEFAPCGCCGRGFMFGQSSVQDHLTKGDQPFQALLATQLRVQPPGPQPASEFAPLRGRKVLIFSDSRQVAARLAPTLQSYSLRDAIRALLPVGFRLLAADPQFAPSLVLDHAFLATLVAAHRYGVRLRPELDLGETMPTIDSVPGGQVPAGPELIRLLTTQCPANLMRAIVRVLRDTGLGLEPLAIASIAEAPSLTQTIDSLPELPRLAQDTASKRAVARAWLRSWHIQSGIWFGGMPPSWWTNEVRTHSGSFDAMDRVLTNRDAKRTFRTVWLPRLITATTRRSEDGGTRLLAERLSLDIGGTWRRCPTCKSVHRPLLALTTCIDCGSQGVRDFDPADDEVFRARRGFYRDPIVRALESDEPGILSLIAAEHTAQLNAAQPDDAFSQAENHELRFQDIDLAWRDTDPREPAIDVLSSTTTMEVGIDIGELSGVALRNMPPGRANYQQRSGRAGRRGNAVATVVAFGSSDSHDDHYFSSPDEMIRGPVSDPRLTLENPDIARRHVRAFLLQRYHEAELPGLDPQANPNLFSVLGSVRDFRSGAGVLNRNRFASWLLENRADLERSLDRWLPEQLSGDDRNALIANMIDDVLAAVDDAIGFVGPEPQGDADVDAALPPEPNPTDGQAPEDEEAEENADDRDEVIDPSADKLLDRLLYRGILPRYAFPTDVASFYVFNRALTTAFAPKMEFAPSQGLNIALSQYAPNKQIWIKGKQYTSKAIYSPYRNERRDAWGRRKLYFECSRCGHARTEDYVDGRRGAVIDCEACRSSMTFGPAKPWFRPPGFAHPIDRDPVTTPDAPNETAYATRAKLVMPTPSLESDWIPIGARVRAFPTRRNLLVTNSGPEGEGYHYCVACGRIESITDPEMNLRQPHDRPYRSDDTEPCPGRVSGHVVLGTDFITDIALFSLPLSAPFRARPGNDETAMALRTVCEALAKAANRILQIEAGEVLAEYRPALTEDGAEGLEVEVFLYDTLAGGAGFAPQLVGQGAELFEEALRILTSCPAGCDASCYRCLRSFRNKLDHRLLDRKLGEQFLHHVLYGGYPTYPDDRTSTSVDLLYDDLIRQFSGNYTFEKSTLRRTADGRSVRVPILATHIGTGRELWIALASPIAPDVPVHEDVRADAQGDALCIDDLLVRRHLPQAISFIRGQLP
jgi:ATP-dependent helicase YprA (DUF1998 family)